MGAFPGEGRKGYRGKLTDVLDHQLRIGDQGVNENIIAAYRERGLQIPDHIENPPEIKAENVVYWEAYRDLITERVQPRGRIPVTRIVLYAAAYALNPDTLKRVVWDCDRVLLEHWKELDEAENAKRQKTIEYKPTLPGGQS